MIDAPATNELRELDQAGLDAAIRECARITAPEISDAEYARIADENSPRYRNTRVEMERTIRAYLAAATPSAQGAEVGVEELEREIEANITFDINGKQAWANGRQASRALLGKYRMEKR